MADRGQQTMLLGLAFIVITGVIGWRSFRTASGARPPAAATGAAQAVPSPDLAPLMPYAAPLPDSAMALPAGRDTVVLRRDPFTDVRSLPAVASRPARARSGYRWREGEWSVSATLIGGARRAAVINDALVYEGDAIPGGGKLTSVERDRVVVTDPHGTSHTVTVKEGDG